MTRWAILLLVLASPAHAAPRSGYADASPPVRAMQDDDTANPGFLWVQQGEGIWADNCSSCHSAATTMRGVSARYPAYDAKLGRPLTLEQRIEQCRTERERAAAFAPEGDELLAITAFVGLQSRGIPMAVDASGPAQSFAERGRELFTTRMGQLNLSCAQCHDDLAGHHLAGALIPQGQPNGYPLYRLEWQSLGSLARRLRNCLTGVRAEPLAPDSPDLVALELYLGTRADGLTVETPAVRP